MRRSALFSVLLLAVAALVLACNSAEQKKPEVAASTSTNPIAQVPGDGVRRITVQETAELMAKGQAVIVDVRNPGSFAQSHIKGAILIPHNEILNHLSSLPVDKTIVTYCA